MAAKITVKFRMPSDTDADRFGIAISEDRAEVITKANSQEFSYMRSGVTPSEVVTADIFELEDGTDLVDKTRYFIIICSGDSNNNWRDDYDNSDVVTTLAEWQYSAPTLTQDEGQPWERVCQGNPVDFDQYFGMNMTQSSAEVLVHDCEAGEYIGIYGQNIVIYPVSEYDLEADEVFGEDTLKRYGPGTVLKAIWDPTQEVQLFGRFDIQNLDELVFNNHITSTRCLIGRDIRQGDWILTPHNNIIYEVVMVKKTNNLFHLAQFFTTVTCLPRLVSGERGVGDSSSHAPEPTSGYFTDGRKDQIEAYTDTIAITGADEETRKDLFGGW